MRRRHGIPAGKFVVGWFGRMTAVKRTDDLLTTLAGVRERGVDALLLLVGDGDDRERLEQRAHDLGLARSCLFLGYQEDVAPVVRHLRRRRADVGERGHAGDDHRGAGRRTARRRHEGRRRPRRRRRGRDRLPRPPGDTHALAERLEILAGDPSAAGAMGERGRARVLERYAVARLVDDVDALYRELLATTSATTRR